MRTCLSWVKSTSYLDSTRFSTTIMKAGIRRPMTALFTELGMLILIINVDSTTNNKFNN